LFFQLPLLPEWLISRNGYQLLAAGFRQANPSRMTNNDIERYRAACAQPGAVPAMIGWYRHAAKYLLKHAGRFPQFNIKRPTCIIWGERDIALEKSCNETLPQYVEQLAIHYLPDASHWVQIDQPETVNQFILDFIHPN
jgi:pimeloyl-ACP methyl ester carboxylesterase